MYCLLTISFKLCLYGGALDRETANRPHKNIWTSQREQLKSLNLMKYALILPPTVALQNSTEHPTFDADACDVLVGCMLIQVRHYVTTKPIGYWSRSLTDAERKYDATWRKFLAVVWAVLTLRPYLDGIRLEFRTEHDSLRWIFGPTLCIGRFPRHRLRPFKFDFNVFYCASIKTAPISMCVISPTNIGR